MYRWARGYARRTSASLCAALALILQPAFCQFGDVSSMSIEGLLSILRLEIRVTSRSFLITVIENRAYQV